MPAFERAVEIGVDVLEMDVQLTRDGQLIVVHDDHCARTTGAQASWAEIDLAQARELDSGWGFVATDGSRPFAGKGITVPTFAEVLERFPTTSINVDLKGGRAVQEMLKLVREQHAEDRVTLASFHTRTAVAVRRGGYAGATGLSRYEVASLLSLPSLFWRQLPFTGNAAQVPTHHGRLRFDRATFIAKCHSLGLRVDFWTIDEPAEATRLLALGADGIMTNDPRAIRPLFYAT
ncbi:MAG: glycerophosphoryl diester phosphodiesterase [Deltaproteobacteria bacterium]|nr:glycerophosphoryl diester phosphodiesterase [Deltaproteobacteria bacterium]